MSSIRIRTLEDGTTTTAVLYRIGKKQTSKSFDDHKAALRYKDLVDKIGPVEAEKILFAEEGVTLTGLTVTEWITEYIDHLTGIEDATRNRYRTFLTRDIAPLLGALPLTAVNDQAIARWVQAQPGSGKTIANKHGFLSAALAGAVSAKHIPANPCDGRRLPPKDSDEMVFLTPEEFAVIRDALPVQWQPLATFLVTTGMRFSEATALQFRDIDAEAGTARISRAWKYTGEATRKLGPPKSKKSRRTINLSDHAIESAGELKGRKPTEFVFTNMIGRPITAQRFHKGGWRPTVVKLEEELGKLPRPHDLRHSCASWMIAAGVPLPVIQQHLGHESITTTVDRYGHLDRRSAQAASDALTAALKGL